MMVIRAGRLELMWAKWTCRTFYSGYAAGGWLRCWYIWRLRIGWNLKVRNVAAWERQPSSATEAEHGKQ